MNIAVAKHVRSTGNDRLLAGLIMGVVTFWLFAQSALNIAPAMREDLRIGASLMNTAVALAALFSGIFTVVFGGLADRIGRLRMVRLGLHLGIAGSLLVALAPPGGVGAALLLCGRALQGLSAACIMPASLALVKTCWDGTQRQRAISLWSIGAWGGAGLCSLFGGLVSQNFGWRAVFLGAVAVCFGALYLLKDAAEDARPKAAKGYRFDLAGVLAFMAAMVAMQLLVTQGGALGWGSPMAMALLLAMLAFGAIFFRIELHSPHAFVDFGLFRNRVFVGAVLSNFLLNASSGTLLVSLQLVQLGGNLGAQEAGMLTIGYAAAIIAFIRVGEKLLQRHGHRRPMLWGCMIAACAIAFLSPANVMLQDYRLLAMAGFTFYGVGLAFYATPATDAALSSLPAAQAGSGAGIFKMASSLGAALGIATSAAVFTALAADGGGVQWLEGVLTFQGNQDNLALRQAAMVALLVNVLLLVLAATVVAATIPKGSRAG